MPHVHTCKSCLQPFTATRVDAETCSTACRLAFHRATRAAREAESLARLEDVLRRLSDLTPKENT